MMKSKIGEDNGDKATMAAVAAAMITTMRMTTTTTTTFSWYPVGAPQRSNQPVHQGDR
jgi:hypothetical protein